MKILGVLIASVIGLFAALFGVASAMSLGTEDDRERREAASAALWSFVTLALCAAAILTLAGCATFKEVECLARDNTARPCN
jgi:multisubunit Na+/H+ antiporter MnhB subunit